MSEKSASPTKKRTKTCPVCKKKKALKQFKNSRNTEDYKYPYCTRCSFLYQYHNRFHRHHVMKRIWVSVNRQMKEANEVGAIRKFGKAEFERFIYLHPDFEKMYQEQYLHQYKTHDFVPVVTLDKANGNNYTLAGSIKFSIEPSVVEQFVHFDKLE